MVPTTWQKIFTSCRNQQAKSCNIPSLPLYDHCHIVPELSGTMPSISLTCLRRKDLQDANRHGHKMRSFLHIGNYKY